MTRRMIIVKGKGYTKTFVGDPERQTLASGLEVITIADPADPSGRRVVWEQEFIAAGIPETVKFTVETID